MMLCKYLTTAASAVILSACSLAPDYQQPELNVFEQSVAASQEHIAALDWQSFYQDEQLKLLISVALDNNKSLAIGDLQLQQLQAKYQISRSESWPDISVNAGVQRQKNSLNQSSALMPEYSTSYNVNIGFTAYELDFFDRVGNLQASALAEYKASEFAQQTLAQTLAAQVASVYFSYQANLYKLGLQHDLLTSAKNKTRVAKLQFQQGLLDESEYRQAVNAEQSINIQLSQLNNILRNYLTELQQLIGYDENIVLDKLTANFNPKQLNALPAQLPASILLNRPDLAQAEQNIVAANANLGVARAAFYPSISLTSNLGFASQSLSDLFKSNSQTWAFSPQLNLPVFNFGRLNAQEQIAELQQMVAVKQYQAAVENAFTEFNRQLNDQQMLLQQRQLQEHVVENKARQLALSQLRQQQGLEEPTIFEENQQALLSAQQVLADLQAAYLQSQVALFKVVGGNYEEKSDVLARLILE